jgi:general secretion pathway protein I
MTRGFSLLETMVALSVFSMAAMGLLSLNTQSVRISGELEARQLAQIVADNVAADTVTANLQMLRPMDSGRQNQRGRTFTWSRSVEPTHQSGLYSVRIDVTADGSQTVLARLGLLTAGQTEQ